MPPSLDPLRYGLRALDEMAREQASVAPPRPTRAETFSPHPVLRPMAREGAALSLRLFTDAEDDASVLLTPGVNLYFGEKVKLQINQDWLLAEADETESESAFRAQLQVLL